MNRRQIFRLTVAVTTMLMLALTALSVSAQTQPTASISVIDQLSMDGTVLIPHVVTDTPAFVVIHADDGSGAPGAVIGFTPLAEGESTDVRVVVDPTVLTPTLYAMVHTDDHEAGTFEFGTVEGADAPITLDGNMTMMPFKMQAILARDQIVTDHVTIQAVTVAQPTWLAIHAGDAQNFGDVIAEALLPAGTTAGATLDIRPGTATDILWLMLHEDTGTAGKFEFGMVEGADLPLVVGSDAATLPISTAPIVRVAADQLILDGTGVIVDGSASVVIGSVLSDGPGFLVVHNNEGNDLGAVVGYTPIPDGLSMSVDVEVDPTLVTPDLWVTLHRDDHEIGVFEFGSAEEADLPATVHDQIVKAGVRVAPFMSLPDSLTEPDTLTFDRVMIDQPGFMVIHADGPMGPVLAEQPLKQGLNTNVAVQLDLNAITEPIYPVLHADDNANGTMDFGTVDGADAPIQLNGRFISAALNLPDLRAGQSKICTVLANADASLYSQPNAGSQVSGSLTQGTTLQITGQQQAADGTLWWETADGAWVSSDVVSEQARCEDVPVVGG